MIREYKSFDVESILGAGGVVSRVFSGFESRPQQVRMAKAVEAAFKGGERLAVEAGTGVGKSFAYLVPAIDVVLRKKGRVLVSTFTITLQEQLINKDIPFLAECFSRDFTAVLAKGRGNYLCLRRLEFAIRRASGLFDEYGSTLATIKAWSQETSDGSLSDMSFMPKNNVWDSVKSEHGNCGGRKCPHFGKCFYWQARRRLESADIIVANHSLMFSDLVLKEQGASVLPDYDYIVIDEAHNIEHVAEGHFGIDISSRRIDYLLNGLFNPRTHKGLLTFIKADKAIDLTAQVSAQAKKFFKVVSKWYDGNFEQTRGRCYKNFVEDTVSGYLRKLRLNLSGLIKSTDDEDEKLELFRFIDRCSGLEQDFAGFMNQERADYVYWVEPAVSSRGTTRLKSAAINVGDDVKQCLFDVYNSVVTTSATLSCGSSEDGKGFDFFANRIGLEDFKAVKLGSPFDYEKQVTIYIEKDLPNPNEKAFVEAAGEALKRYILRSQGRAFVLFTSYKMLGEIAEHLSDWFEDNEIELLEQGGGIDRTVLLGHFKSGDRSVLFGTDSFWQGVDVPGEALSNVIIVKLPFAVPDRPLLAGRLEQIRKQGGNPFFDYQLPSAIIKFKQGFGRLIRSKSDKGIVVILDSRIVNKRYGQKFLDAIPRCRVEVVSSNKPK